MSAPTCPTCGRTQEQHAYQREFGLPSPCRDAFHSPAMRLQEAAAHLRGLLYGADNSGRETVLAIVNWLRAKQVMLNQAADDLTAMLK